MADTRWLQKRSRGWYAVKDVPRPLRKVIGKKRLIASLGTRDVHVARAKRHAALIHFERILADARHRTADSPIIEAGLSWREAFAALTQGDPAAIRSFGGAYGGIATARLADGREVELTAQEDALDTAKLLFGEQAEGIGETEGDTAAETFMDVARGSFTPLLQYVDSWLAEGGTKGDLNERTKRQYRADLAALERWTRTAGLPPSIEAVTKKAAGRYVTETLVAANMTRTTANRKISAASAYWRWLVKRVGVTDNPWREQSLAKGTRGAEKPKRPFTDDEVVALLNGPADPELADAIRIAALSGMRLDEPYRLTVADCAGGWFNLRRTKTDTPRRVPIHPALAQLVARRCAEKPLTAFFFHEPGAAQSGRERSAAVSKRFGRYRVRLGVHEPHQGGRQSQVDFHSFRRWFITKARNAGIDHAVVAAVVGHQTGSITDDTYSGGPSDAQRRACVEAVQLPVAV